MNAQHVSEQLLAKKREHSNTITSFKAAGVWDENAVHKNSSTRPYTRGVLMPAIPTQVIGVISMLLSKSRVDQAALNQSRSNASHGARWVYDLASPLHLEAADFEPPAECH